jgi:hypothetical protein
VHPIKTVSPAVVRELPAALHTAYVDAVAASLHPVFVVAAVISAGAFVLTWFLHEVPLRQTTRSAAADAAPIAE